MQRISILRSQRRRARGVGSRAIAIRPGSRRRWGGDPVEGWADGAAEEVLGASEKMEFGARSPEPGRWAVEEGAGKELVGFCFVKSVAIGSEGVVFFWERNQEKIVRVCGG